MDHDELWWPEYEPTAQYCEACGEWLGYNYPASYCRGCKPSIEERGLMRHDHKDPEHHKNIDGRCCCCGATWEPIPFPGKGSEMVHANKCAYLVDDE